MNFTKLFSLFFVVLLVLSTANALRFPTMALAVEDTAATDSNTKITDGENTITTLIDLPPSLSFSSSTYNTTTIAVLTAVAVDTMDNRGIQWIRIYQDGTLLEEKNCNSLATCTFSKTIVETRAITHDYYAVTRDLGSNTVTSSTFSVVFAGQNQDPVITAYTPLSPTAINENSQQIFTVTAYDPNNDPLTYTWRYDGVTVSTNAGTYTRDFDYFSSGAHVLSVTITDGYGGVAVRTWNINVANVLIPTTCTLDFNPLSPQIYGTFVTASCSCTSDIGAITETTAVLTRNLIDVTATENNIATLLEAGTHDYVCFTAQTANFAAAQDIDTYIIDRADHTIHLELNGVEADLNGVYPFATNATGWLEITQEVDTAILDRDGTQVATGSPAEELATLAAGTYVYTYTYPQSQNYTLQTLSRTLTIDRATSACTLTFDLASPQIYGIDITPTCACTNPEAPAVLTVDGNAITSGMPISLAAGTHAFDCSVVQTQNYTAAQDTANYDILQADPDLHLAIDGNEMDMTYPYPTLTNVTGWMTSLQGTLDLYRDGVIVANPEIATLDAGIYNYTLDYIATENYTAATVSRTLTITAANAACTLTFDGNNVDSYVSDYTTPVNVTCTCTNPEIAGELYRDGVLLSDLSVIETLGAGDYNYICNASATTNYVYAEDSGNLTVNPIAPVLTLTALPDWNVDEGTETTVECTANTIEVTPELFIDLVSVSNPDVQTLAAGIYNYTCDSISTQNYTAASVSNILTVNATVVVNTAPVVVLNSPVNVTINDNLTVDFNYTATDAEQATVSCELFADGVSIDVTTATSGVENIVSYTFAGYGLHEWNVTCDDLELANNLGYSETAWIYLNDTSFVDTEAPVIILEAPANGTTLITADATLVYNVTDNSNAIQNCSLLLNGAFDSMQGPLANGQYNFALTGLADGTYTWQVECYDFAGNYNISDLWEFVVDTTILDTEAPNVTINNPLAQTYITSGVLIDITAVDNVAVDSIWFNYNGTDVPYTASFTETFADGDYTLIAYANDTSGNIGSAEVNFTVDTTITNTAPWVVLNDPWQNTIYYDEFVIDFNYTGYDNEQTSLTCNLFVENVSVNTTTVTQGIEQIVTYTFADYGDYNWYVECNDGFASNVSETRTLHIINVYGPNTQPIVTLNAPANNSAMNDTQDVDFSFTAVDNQQTTVICSLYLDGALNTTMLAVNNTLETIQITNIDYGAHNWYVSCNDTQSINNIGVSETWYFTLVNTTVPNTAPWIVLNLPANDTTINDNLTADFSYTGYDNEAATLNCNLYVDGTVYNNIVTNGVLQPVQHTFALFGDYTWYVDCTDGLLNAVSETRTLHLVNTTNPAPSIVLNLPLDGSTFANGTTSVTLDWTSADDGASVTDVVYVNSGSGFAAVDSQTHASGTYNYGLTVADGTTYQWYVTTNDGTTMIQSATWTFTVNSSVPNNAPVVILNTPLNNSQINNTNTVVFNFTATDDLSASLTCNLYLDGALNQTVTAANGAAETITVSNITYGAHNWYVSCNDGTLTGTSATWYFNLNDTIAPLITIVSPANNSNLISTTVALTYNLNEQANWCAYNLDNSSTNITLTNCANTTFTALDGQHTVTVYARDLYGNIGSATSLFRVNTSSTVMGTVYNTAPPTTLANATVQLRNGSVIVAQTTSAADGTYTLSARSGTYTLYTSRAGFYDNSTSVTLSPTSPITQDVVLQPIITIGNLNGYVRDADNYLYGATVQLKLGNATMYTATTDANGYYSIANIQQDSYTIVVSKSGFNTYTNTVTINGGATVQRNVTLTASVLSGRITGAVYENVTYTGVANATVYIYQTGTSNLIQVVKTASNGNYVVNGLVTSIGYDLNATSTMYPTTIWPATGVYVPEGGTNSGNGIIIG